ncbi:MAG: GntR family transcriptional regulator, partial [Mycobacterium sp.]|nr:GntR family transcriptional regulator [Mycobacterium sp.]
MGPHHGPLDVFGDVVEELRRGRRVTQKVEQRCSCGHVRSLSLSVYIPVYNRGRGAASGALPAETDEEERVSRTDTAYDRIAEAIGDFVLPPGHPLPENELSDWLGVSRTPIRSALARLAADGLVEISPGRPARVSAISLDTVVSIYQLRQAVEVYAARLACLADDRSEFDELATAYRAAASDPKNFDVVSAELGERYRLALRECSGNGPLCDV